MSDLNPAILAILTASQTLSETLNLDLSTPTHITSCITTILESKGITVDPASPLLSEILVLSVRAALDHLPSITELYKVLESDPVGLKEEAIKYLYKAAKLYHADSQSTLSHHLITGHHIPKNDYEALGWLVSASRTTTNEKAVTADIATLLISSTQLEPVDPSDVLDVLINGCRDAFFGMGERASVEVWEKYATGRDGGKGDAHCMHELAGIYATGEGGVPESIPTSSTTTSPLPVLVPGKVSPLSPISTTPTPSPLPPRTPTQPPRRLHLPPKPRLHNPSHLTSTKSSILQTLSLPSSDAYPAQTFVVRERDVVGGDGDVEGARKAVMMFLEGDKREGKKMVLEVLERRKRGFVKWKAENGDLEKMVEYAKTLDSITDKKSWLNKAAEKGSPAALYALYELGGDSDPEAVSTLKRQWR
ncbi:hypothetical protein BC829DRAFT_72918 [Chytridium lagenaria]|nr:hypothetical protein BC829DRAFT_72918 [Chytridium lagenaria]